ncbi:flagellar export chaperone FliS [Neobacillus sp. LXY-1]|uniref:flagellar export chaperone FliS n=1 Tax=Neobacillus sp. LXY-1 TaxID=3379133 RepID=UPI003EDEEFE4
MLNNPYQTYQKQAVNTSKPEDLTYMLYQGIVKFIRLSKIAIENNNFEDSHHYNLRAQDIVSELMITLKQEFEVSKQLASMYDYMKRRLMEANLKKSTEILEEVEGYAVELMEAWSEAMKSNKATN